MFFAAIGVKKEYLSDKRANAFLSILDVVITYV